jgi:hypothetical protein
LSFLLSQALPGAITVQVETFLAGALGHSPLPAQSALDRFANNAYQITIEGESYREKQGPNAKSKNPKKGGKSK